MHEITSTNLLQYRDPPFKDSRYFKKSYKINQNGYDKIKPGNREISVKRISENVGLGKYTRYQDNSMSTNILMIGKVEDMGHIPILA